MKMRTREITTADVVDSPTPLAPPVVVKPQEQLTCEFKLTDLGFVQRSSAGRTPEMHIASATGHVCHVVFNTFSWQTTSMHDHVGLANIGNACSHKPTGS